MKFIIFTSFVFVSLLSGCSNIPEQDNHGYVRGIKYYVPDFPKLEVNITTLTNEEIDKKCSPHTPSSSWAREAVACSEINLDKKTCEIFIPKNVERWALEHEKAHCIGGDHDNVISDYYKKWKSLNTSKK